MAGRLNPPNPAARFVRRATLLAAASALLWASGCGRNEAPEEIAAAPAPSVFDIHYLHPVAIGRPLEGTPWFAQVTAVDLDHDGLMDILACEAKKNQILWFRQTTRGKFQEIVLDEGIPAPVHVTPVDLRGTGHYDLLIASMGQVFPDNDKIGSVVVLENDGHEHFTRRVLIDHVARVTDVEPGHFTHSGRIDLAVAQFGYDQGEIRWMENMGGGQFRSHILLSLSGAINVCVADMTGDGNQDIVSVVSQQYEEIHFFKNDGAGNFTDKVLWGSTNEDFGSSGISLCDLNGDGRPDILYTNGDGFDYAEPGPRPWHGVQWLENLGHGAFKYHRIGNMAGAFSPVGVDLDGDGHSDVVAVSGFNHWDDPEAASLVVFQNDGHMNFTPHVLAHVPNHLMTVTAADLDGNGRPVLVTGGFYAYGPWDHMSRVMVWRRSDLK
jgi:hypothetical protein